jgi:hypothetical protein
LRWSCLLSLLSKSGMYHLIFHVNMSNTGIFHKTMPDKS